MFITNKRINTPSCIEFNGIKVEVVSQFKLLGVVNQFKLFVDINRKLYSINILFYLPYEIKLHFFKSFILPYFDYGISLSIYYQKTAIRK
jgi:hypothetical protein